MENQVNIDDQNSQTLTESQMKQKINYWMILTVILTIALFGSLYTINLMSKKVQNKNTSSAHEANTTKNNCVFTGAMQKLSYTKLSNILDKVFCDNKYQLWTKVKNDPFTFQALIPSYYKHQPDYGGLSFDISHPVYGNFLIGDRWSDGGGEMKRGGWSEIEKNLCVGVDMGNIPNNISAFEYFTDDTSGNFYMVKQDGSEVVIMSPISGHYWGMGITYQSKPEDTYGSSSFKEQSLLRDPEFLCFLGSIDLVSSPSKSN